MKNDVASFVYCDPFQVIINSCQKVENLHWNELEVILHVDAYEKGFKKKKFTTIQIEVARGLEIMSDVMDVCMINGGDKAACLLQPLKILDGQINSLKERQIKVSLGADMCALLAIYGLCVAGSHNCIYCTHNKKNPNQVGVDERTIESLKEDSMQKRNSVGHLPLLENIPLTEVRICGLHCALRLSELLMKKTLNFAFGNNTLTENLRIILKSIGIEWDPIKGKTKGTKVKPVHFKKISLHKDEIYRLIRVYPQLINIFHEKQNIDLLQKSWESFSHFMPYLVKTIKLKEEEIQAVAKSMDSFVAAMDEMVDATPYMHWIIHLKNQMIKDKTIGFYSMQRGEQKHYQNRVNWHHSSKGGGRLEATPEENMKQQLQREIRQHQLKRKNAVKKLFK